MPANPYIQSFQRTYLIIHTSSSRKVRVERGNFWTAQVGYLLLCEEKGIKLLRQSEEERGSGNRVEFQEIKMFWLAWDQMFHIPSQMQRTWSRYDRKYKKQPRLRYVLTNLTDSRAIAYVTTPNNFGENMSIMMPAYKVESSWSTSVSRNFTHQ